MMPVLYSYRRCPYAMRARMALAYAGIAVEHREISLKNKPPSMLLASPKGTVPVLCVNGCVLDQSLGILHWALGQADPHGWSKVDQTLAQTWIEKNDGPFKLTLDQYKYPNRYPEIDPKTALISAREMMFEPMEAALQSSAYLMGGKMTWVDIAIFPFIRQFSMVNLKAFESLPYPMTQRWLKHHLESSLFESTMQKYPLWIE